MYIKHQKSRIKRLRQITFELLFMMDSWPKVKSNIRKLYARHGMLHYESGLSPLPIFASPNIHLYLTVLKRMGAFYLYR